MGFVEPEGPHDAQIALAGQGPGQQEALLGRPLYPMAPAGHRLTGWLARAGVPRSRVLLLNTVPCWLPARRVGSQPQGNRDPSPAVQRACWERYVGPFLHRLARQGSLRHVVAVGGSATRFLLQLPESKGFERWVGSTQLRGLPPCESAHSTPSTTGDLAHVAG